MERSAAELAAIAISNGDCSKGICVYPPAFPCMITECMSVLMRILTTERYGAFGLAFQTLKASLVDKCGDGLRLESEASRYEFQKAP